jgi:hypothetical protein
MENGKPPHPQMYYLHLNWFIDTLLRKTNHQQINIRILTRFNHENQKKKTTPFRMINQKSQVDLLHPTWKTWNWWHPKTTYTSSFPSTTKKIWNLLVSMFSHGWLKAWGDIYTIRLISDHLHVFVKNMNDKKHEGSYT